MWRRTCRTIRGLVIDRPPRLVLRRVAPRIRLGSTAAGYGMRGLHREAERPELGDEPVQVRLVDHVTVEDRLRRLGDAHSHEPGSGRLGQRSVYAEFETNRGHQPSSRSRAPGEWAPEPGTADYAPGVV